MDFSLPVIIDEFFFAMDSFSSPGIRSGAYLEIGFLLSGSAHVFLGQEHYVLQKKDVFLSNCSEYCDISSIGGEPLHILSLFIFPSLLKNLELANIRFENFASHEARNREIFDPIKRHLARLFRSYYDRPLEHSLLESYQNVFALLTSINKSFGVRKLPTAANNAVQARMQGIAAYIEENYREEITLNAIAQQEFLSIGHLSRMFHQNMGMSFTKYLQQVRLIHASKDLYTTSQSITDIAMNNGFSSANAFITSFKQSYGITPGAVRFSTSESAISEYGSQPSDLFQRLLEYIDVAEPTLADTAPTRAEKEVIIDCTSGGIKQTNLPVIDYVTINLAESLLLQSVQNQVLCSHRDLGYTHLCIHGCFCDSMMVYREDPDGKPHLNFTYTDLALDFVISSGLVPHIALDHMPYQLALSPKILYNRGIYEGPPKSMKKWSFLVRSFISHCIGRYGAAEVRKWSFAPPNANLVYSHFFTLPEYIELYHELFRIAKDLDPEISVFAMEHYIDVLEESDFSDLNQFLDYCSKNRCIPDGILFRGFHSSLSKSLFLPKDAVENKRSSIRRQSPDSTQHFLRHVRAFCKKNNCANMKIIIDVWNSAMIPEHDQCNDTCYKSAYFAKNFLECRSRNLEFNYWNLTDFQDNLNPDQEIFHGGCGLYTFNEIPKSVYYAIMLLNRMGSCEFARGEGYYLAKSKNENRFQLALYNYCHFDFNIVASHSSSPFDRYNVFEERRNFALKFTLENMPTGQYTIEEYILNQEHGDAYSRWISMGAPLQLKEQQRDWLQQSSLPQYQSRSSVSFGSVELSAVLSPHELRIYFITFEH